MANLVGQQWGNYRVLRLLGRGGFAEVYLGEHVYLKSNAALKVLHTMLTDEESAAFMQEARMLTRLRHQHIVHLLDFAVEAGTPYLVLEYAAGGTLRSRHPRGSRLPLSTIISYVLQVASALQYAHDQGFIHRDVKPENLLLSSQDEILLSDFGLAIFAPHTHLYSTQVMGVSGAGTSPYLAPEQLQGQAVLASDQYALGAVVYEWLCGTPPFSGTPVEIAIQHYSAPPPSLRRFLPDLPASIDHVVLQALSKSPQGRFTSVNEFATTLERAYNEAFPSTSLLSINSVSSPEYTYVPASSSSIVATRDQSALETPTAIAHAPLPMPTKHEPLWKIPATFLPLVGREQEVTAICTLLKQPATRLLTLLGMGGIGKTRLSIEVASRMRDYFTDGVYFVPLAAISDANLVMSTIAHELGIQEEQFMDALITLLRNKHFLLILDNFEQVAMVAPHLEELLGACPHLTLLITSRSVLHLQAEHLFPVPPLSQPDLKQLPAYELLMQYAAVAFFVQRTQALLSTFQLTSANAQAIASICVYLDGLPLALELAAARMRLLSPQALLQRLSQSLNVLTRGMQKLSMRQQTLRNTLQWSYELLQPYEQRLFRLLSVFVGGCTLEAVEAICIELDYGNSKAGFVFDGIDALLDNCLLQQGRQEEDEPRLMMLETVREYALECLMASGEFDAVMRAYVAYYQRFAQEGARKYFGVEQAKWFAQLEREHDNLRITLNWLLENGQAEQALYLSNNLFQFWLFLGYYSEGRKYLEQGLSGIEVSTEHSGNAGLVRHVRARSIQTLAMLVINLGDVVLAETLWEESVKLFRELGDKRGATWSQLNLSFPAMSRGEFAKARYLLEESLALFRELGDKGGGVNVEGGGAYPPDGLAEALNTLATVAMYQGEYTRARSLAEESLTRFKKIAGLLAFISFQQGKVEDARTLCEENLVLAREEGIPMGIGVSLHLLARIALQQDDIATAHSFVEESLAIWRQVGDQEALIEALCLSGKVAIRQSDYVTAKRLYEESLGMMFDRGHRLFIAAALEGLAEVVALQGEPIWAVRLWGAAEFLRETMGTPIPPVERSQYEQAVAAVRTHMGEKAFAIAWAEGRAMSVEQVLAARFPITVVEPALPPPAKTPVPYPDELTRREVEVLRLVVQGLTNAQIAEQLIISPRTVNTHLTSIYGKIQVSSRSAATRYAIEHKFV